MDQFPYGFGLINLLREAPGNPVIWEKFLAQLTKKLNCESSFLLINHLINRDKTHFLFHFNISDKQLKCYNEYDNQLNAFNFFIGKNPHQVFCNQNVIDSDFIKFTDEKPLFSTELQYRFGLSIPCNHYFISLHINRDQPFTKQELQNNTQLLQDIISPLEEAIHAEQQQKIHSQLIHHSYQPFDGYLIVDQQLNIVLANPVYKLIFTVLDCIECYKNQLIINDTNLKSALLAKLASPAGQFETLNHCSNCRIGLLPVKVLDNLYSWECFKDDFILTFASSKYRNSTVSRLMNVHKLSRSEALCALHFLNTPSIVDIAEKTCRSQNTVRNHIKRIMHKMDVHNQAALMKKLIALASL